MAANTGGTTPDGTVAGGMAPDDMTYEELVAALEELTDRMASGTIGIEEAAALYEMAGTLHAAAAARLARVQERIDRLRDQDEADE